MVLLGSIPFFKKKEENIEGNPLILLLEVIFFCCFFDTKIKGKKQNKKNKHEGLHQTKASAQKRKPSTK